MDKKLGQGSPPPSFGQKKQETKEQLLFFGRPPFTFQYYLLIRKDDNQKLTTILTLLLDHGAKVTFFTNVKPISWFFTSSNGKDRLSKPLETTLTIGYSIAQTH